MFVREWEILVPLEEPENCIVALSGRGMPASMLLQFCGDLYFSKTLIISLRPYGHSWYPQPISSKDQKDAVEGLEKTRHGIIKNLQTIKNGWGFDTKDIALIGFSAGAVVSLYTATRSKTPFKAAISLAGAIFEPEKVPICQHSETKFLLCHNQDDNCFDWFERYLPMKEALLERGYDVQTLERYYGGHCVTKRDVMAVSDYLGPILNYGEEWIHPGFAQT